MVNESLDFCFVLGSFVEMVGMGRGFEMDDVMKVGPRLVFFGCTCPSVLLS